MRFTITEEEKNLIRKMYIFESGDDPRVPLSRKKLSAPPLGLIPPSSEKLTMPSLGSNQKNILKTNLFNVIQNKPELHYKLGLDDTHDEENFLDKISHMTHAHYDPNTQHLGISFPELGSQHNITFDLGFDLNSHKETHDDNHHGNSQLPLSTPHSVFDFGIEFPLKNIFGK